MERRYETDRINVSWGYDFEGDNKYEIWTPKRTWGESYFVIDTEKHACIGPLGRWDILRTFRLANARIEVGDSRFHTMNPGFRELYQPTKLNEELEAFDRVDPTWVSPCLTFYRWRHDASDAPVDWCEGALVSEQLELLGEALDIYQLSREPRWGTLKEQRNFHIKGSLVLQDPEDGASYAILDSAP